MTRATQQSVDPRIDRLEEDVRANVQAVSDLTAGLSSLRTQVTDVVAGIRDLKDSVSAVSTNLVKHTQPRYGLLISFATLGLGVVTVVGGVISYAINRPNEAMFRAMNDQILQNRSDLLKEVERNNIMDYQRGRTDMLIDLYMNSKLSSDPPKPPPPSLLEHH